MKAAPNQNRKIIYGLLIVALFGAMFPYSNWLNREKKRKDLGEAAIGQIDTGSFMLKLALLGGARGVAANVLWVRAEELKREQDWDRMKTTVDFITKLQPHFLSVWTFQGWNLAYNVSVEWDAPEDKYEWIKKGIQFLKEGVQHNKKSPDLMWDTAWTYYHKLGFADESIILRRLFHDDDDTAFTTYPDPETGVEVHRHDNFQLGYGWFANAIALVDSREGSRTTTGIEANLDYVDPVPQRKGRPGDLAFRAMPAHAQTRYAASLEKMSMLDIPAQFGQVAQNEWSKALDEWIKFGTYKYETFSEVMIDGRLQKQPVYLDDATHPEKLKTLSDNQKYWAQRWGDQMNYRFWKDRSAAEMTLRGVSARKHFYDGTIAYKTAVFDKAVQEYREGLDIWENLLKEHPDYSTDDLNKKDTGLIVLRYVHALKQLGAPEPKAIPFKELMKGAERDPTVDPFDANEMIGPRPPSGGAKPGPDGPTPPRRPPVD